MKQLDVIRKMFGIKTEDKDKEEVKKVKVRAKDIQEHIRWIDEEMKRTLEERVKFREIRKELMTLDPDDDGVTYSRLMEEAKVYEDADERYTKLQEQKEKEYVILKKYKDSKFYVPPDRAMIIGGVLLVAIFAIALEREDPKALKLSTFILKLFPVKL